MNCDQCGAEISGLYYTIEIWARFATKEPTRGIRPGFQSWCEKCLDDGRFLQVRKNGSKIGESLRVGPEMVLEIEAAIERSKPSPRP